MGRAFEARKQSKMKRWDRMAKAFTRAGKEIAMAVRAGGPDPDANPTLRRAIQNARSVNMPNDRIDSAIKKASGEGATDYEIVTYEGYAPHGIAIFIEAATDNPVRTVANLRLHFKKNNGNLGNNGSVAYLFERYGVFNLDPANVEDRDELELTMIDHGLEELDDGTDDEGNPLVVCRCAFNDFGTLQDGFETEGIEVKSSGNEYIPGNLLELDDEKTDEVLALIDALEQDDDVNAVFHNLA